ncbi:hypothetical protein HID58_082083 [Brassica napus]|uniref:Uncharacterized protein n=1 Tax=Brassica napus TaxID=3708 RepID=A0ABQ7Y9N1_BRANA|nr:hypothetical protein HID58_082083 [Brassica napus]
MEIKSSQPKRLINDTQLTPRRFSLPIKGKQRKFSIMANSSVLLGYLKTGDCSYTVHSTVMPATMNVNRLATYRDRLQAGFTDVLNEPDSHIPEERFRFGDHDSLLGPANTNTHLLVCLTHKRSLFTRNLKVVVASSINPKMVGGRLSHMCFSTRKLMQKLDMSLSFKDQSKQNTFRSRLLIYST